MWIKNIPQHGFPHVGDHLLRILTIKRLISLLTKKLCQQCYFFLEHKLEGKVVMFSQIEETYISISRSKTIHYNIPSVISQGNISLP